MAREKIFLASIFSAVILASFWFINTPQTPDGSVQKTTDFTLNSKPKINLLFPQGESPEVFSEPTEAQNNYTMPSQEANEAANEAQKIKKRAPNPADLGPGMTIDLKSVPQRLLPENFQNDSGEKPAPIIKEPVYLPQIFENSPKLEANQLISIKLLSPRNMAGVGDLLNLLRGFGELINVPRDELTWEFTSKDRAILQKTKEVYGNPANFELGEQCGGEGAAWSYPPGRTTSAQCGGEPEYSVTGGGGSCNTDPFCFGTGFCFRECYSYVYGGYCYCWVPSCLGKCGFQSYLWDDVTGSCGCGV